MTTVNKLHAEYIKACNTQIEDMLREPLRQGIVVFEKYAEDAFITNPHSHKVQLLLGRRLVFRDQERLDALYKENEALRKQVLQLQEALDWEKGER